MGSHFEAYIEELAKLITSDLIHNKYSSSVRKEATRMCSSLIFCCSNNTQRVELLRMFMPHIAQQIQAKLEVLDFRSLKWLLKEVSRCIN
jgi:hypothetical protein